MPDTTYQTKVYEKQGGDEIVVASGGKITVEAGGQIDASSGTLAIRVENAGKMETLSRSVPCMKIIPIFGRLEVERNREIDEPTEWLIERFFDPGSMKKSASASRNSCG